MRLTRRAIRFALLALASAPLVAALVADRMFDSLPFGVMTLLWSMALIAAFSAALYLATSREWP
ncbi:MAG TPA: hypothetical protein VG099_10295 [Gemmataceae bacterium]|jgi:hypothetical protein|nr:hypothetical protein [Gemmataceae bacterium]